MNTYMIHICQSSVYGWRDIRATDFNILWCRVDLDYDLAAIRRGGVYDVLDDHVRIVK